MNQTLSELAQLLDRPETHRMILNGYVSEYSLGVTRCDNGPGGYGFLLRVRGNAPQSCIATGRACPAGALIGRPEELAIEIRNAGARMPAIGPSQARTM